MPGLSNRLWSLFAVLTSFELVLIFQHTESTPRKDSIDLIKVKTRSIAIMRARFLFGNGLGLYASSGPNCASWFL